ncbi:MAG: hypothetical protein NTX50_07475 [Candidatus Sumerlaeota bacterium]|nr:hypothetical protein [Candidatus Sumerlaeota bacterium]
MKRGTLVITISHLRSWTAIALLLAADIGFFGGFLARAQTSWTLAKTDADSDNYAELVAEGPWVLAVFQNLDPRDLGYHGASPFIIKDAGSIASTYFASMFDIEHIFIFDYGLRIGRRQQDGQGAAWRACWRMRRATAEDDPFNTAPPHLTLRSMWSDLPESGTISGNTGLRFECDWALLTEEKTVLQRIAIINETTRTQSATILAGYPGFSFSTINPLGTTRISVSAEGKQETYVFRDKGAFAEFILPRHPFNNRQTWGASASYQEPHAAPFQVLEFGGGVIYCVSTIRNPHACNTTGVGTLNDQTLFHSSSLINLFNQVDIPSGKTACAWLAHHFYKAADWQDAQIKGAQWAAKIAFP